MSLGGSSSSNRSTSESQGQSMGLDYSRTYIDPTGAQNQAWLGNRFQNRFGALGRTPGLDRNRMDVMGDLRGMQNQLGHFAGNLRQQGMAGVGALQQFAQQNNPYLQSQIHGLAQDAGQMFREQILPGIGSQAQLAGQRGSSRQGIAEAQGAQRVFGEYLQGVNDLRANAYAQQQAAAGQLGQLGIGGAMDAYGMQGNLQGMQGGLANQFAQTGLQAQMMPFQIGQGVFGAPQILSQSFGLDQASQYAKSRGSGGGQSLSLGLI